MISLKTIFKGRIRKAALAAAASVLALGAGFSHFDGPRAAATEAPAQQGPTVTVAPPKIKEITEWDEYTGRFEAVDSVEVRARVSGYLTEIAFKDGQMVKKGDLLFRIDSRPFAADLAAARAELNGALAALASARDEDKRGQKLLERQALSKEEAERRTRALREAEAAANAARARADQAALNLEYSEIRAPISGRVSDRAVSQGNLVNGGAQGGTLLTTIVSTNPIYFTFTASEADYIKYTRLAAEHSRPSSRDTANPVQVKLIDEDAFRHEGVMNFVDNQIDPSTGTMRGRASFKNDDGLFVPGMFGRMRLVGSGKYEAVLIPDSAVQTDQTEKFVWVVDKDSEIQRRKIELGPIAEDLRVVRKGLAKDDRVVVGGVQFVQPGAPVTAVPADAERLAALRLN